MIDTAPAISFSHARRHTTAPQTRRVPNASSRWSVFALVLLVGIGVGRIALTYKVFTQTNDEPFHIACGMRWLRGTFVGCVEQPPLALVAAAIGPYLDGTPDPALENAWDEGNAILHNRDTYMRTLRLARVGILPFFIIASVVLWRWTKSLFGEPAALFATLLFTSLPPVLAHAGLATTDMAFTAFFLCALYSFTRWLWQPNLPRTALFGLCLGLAVLSKFSTFVFLPSCVVGILALLWLIKRPDFKTIKSAIRRRTPHLLISLMLASALIWAGYRFSATPLTNPKDEPQEVIRLLGIDRVFSEGSRLRELAYRLVEAPIPGSHLVEGLRVLRAHNASGQNTYLLGEYSHDGWWYFFIVVLLVKTPIAFLLLFSLGVLYLLQDRKRGNWERLAPIVYAISILISVLPSRINLGVRHILAIYPMLAMISGYGLATLFRPARTPILVALAIGLLLWNSVSSALVHPDYLAYFNEFAGGEPDKILVGSDLDWGQDLQRLSEQLRELGIKKVNLAYFGTADLSRHGLPDFQLLVPYQPTHGWIAISESTLKMVGKMIARAKGRSTGAFDWLENYKPVHRIGKSIRLYYVPETEVKQNH
jgi:Dolichyl-phosphate-mannose-protein mannosyltransferase